MSTINKQLFLWVNELEDCNRQWLGLHVDHYPLENPARDHGYALFCRRGIPVGVLNGPGACPAYTGIPFRPRTSILRPGVPPVGICSRVGISTTDRTFGLCALASLIFITGLVMGHLGAIQRSLSYVYLAKPRLLCFRRRQICVTVLFLVAGVLVFLLVTRRWLYLAPSGTASGAG